MEESPPYTAKGGQPLDLTPELNDITKHLTTHLALKLVSCDNARLADLCKRIHDGELEAKRTAAAYYVLEEIRTSSPKILTHFLAVCELEGLT